MRPPDDLERRNARRRELRRLLLGPVVVVAIAIVLPALFWSLIGPLLARWETGRVATRRLAGHENLDELLARYPRTEENASARRLQEIAATIGVDLAQKDDGRAPHPADASKKEFEALKDALSKAWDHQLLRADDEAQRLPPELRDFLARHEREIDTAAGHLRSAAPPVWRSDASLGFEAPLPNLLGHIQLQRLLLLRALQLSAAGDDERALDVVDASWRLNQTIAKRLELISGLIALVVDRYEHRTLRLLRRVPPTWDTRIRSFRFLDANALELRGEAVMALAAGRHPERGEIAVGAALRPFLAPYISLGLAEHVDRMDRLAIVTSSLTARDLEGPRIEDLWVDRHPRWNIVGKIAWPNLADSSRKSLRRDLDDELTILILRFRRGETLPASIPSASWPGRSWTVERDPHGKLLSIELTPRYREPMRKTGVELPLRFVTRRADR